MTAAVAERSTIRIAGSQTAGQPFFGRTRMEAVQAADFFAANTVLALSGLGLRREDWDGHGSPAPRPAAVGNAAAKLVELTQATARVASWEAPYVSSDEEGNVTFEWWNGSRKITLYFDDTSMEMLAVWGPDVESEMIHVPDANHEHFAKAWAWLFKTS